MGALTSDAYRFRARPWDIEDAGTVCTLCPSQCNIKLTVRDEKHPARPRPRQLRGRRRVALRQGPLRLPGDRVGRADRRADGPPRRRARAGGLDEALEAAADGPAPGGRADRRDRRRVLLERGGLPDAADHAPRARLAARDLEPRRRRPIAAPSRRARRGPSARARASPTSTVPSRSSSSAPIPCIRCRSSTCASARSCAATAPGWLIATDRPTALDGGAEETARYAPGFSAAFTTPSPARPASRATSAPRVSSAPTPSASPACCGPARRSSSGRESRTARSSPAPERSTRSCSRSPPARTAAAFGRSGAFRWPVLGFSEAPQGLDAADICEALTEGGLDAAFLVNADPVREAPDGPAWSEALTKADFVLAISMFEDASTKHADVVFPAESYAEKEGTVTHPDGRLQRVRPGVPNPGRARPTWEVLVELSALLGEETGIDSVKRGAGGDRLGGPLLRRDHRGGDRRPGRPLAGPRGGRGLPRLREAAPGRLKRRPRRARTRDADGRRPPSRRLPRPLGRGGHRPQPRAPLPGAEADDRARTP